MRKTFTVIGILLLLAALLVWFFKFNLDGIARKTIEKEGGQITGVTVQVAEVYLSSQTGAGRMRDLIVGNPEGFHTPYAFSFADIHFEVDLPSLQTQLFIVRKFNVAAPNINIEQTANGNNIQRLQAHIKSFVDAHIDNNQTEVRRFIIESLNIENAKLHVSAPLIQADLVTIPLPDINMANIGKDQGGVTSAQLVQLVMQQVNIQIAQAIKSRGLESMIDVSELAPQTVTFKDRIRNFFKPLIDAH
jgi:hypothetical protein